MAAQVAGSRIDGTTGADNIYGKAGNDVIYGGGGNDSLRGQAGNDALYGGAGNDFLDGGLGADTMAGGDGNDTYIVDDLADAVLEEANGGIDTVRSFLSYTLGANLENLELQGTAGLTATGNTLVNVIKGNAGANAIYGGGGNDSISGGAGDDVLYGGDGGDWLQGGAGADTFVFGKGDTADSVWMDRVADLNFSETDTLKFAGFGAGGGDVTVHNYAELVTFARAQNAIVGERPGTPGSLLLSFGGQQIAIVDTGGTGTAAGSAWSQYQKAAAVNTPAVIGGVTTGTVKEDTTATTGGLLTVSDVDAGQAAFQPLTAVAVSYGTVSLTAAGAWTYVLDDTNTYVQALREGQTLTERMTFRSVDNTAQAIDVTIQGTNDGASFGGATSGTVTEDTALIATGTLTVSDPDNGQSTFQPLTDVKVTFGTISLTADGHWTYQLDNANAYVQALGADKFLTERMTVRSADNSFQPLAIEIHGTSDAPVVTAPLPDKVATAGTVWAYQLPTDAFTDVDSPRPTLTATLANGAALPSWLTFDPALWLFRGSAPTSLNRSLDVTVTASDGVLSTSDTFTIAINHAPDPGHAQFKLAEDKALPITSAALVGFAKDLDGDAMSVTSLSNPLHGSFDPADPFRFVPDKDYSGDAGFDYIVSDGRGGTATGHASISVEPVQDAPVARDDVVTINEDEPYTISGATLLANDSDPDGDTLTYAGASNPQNGQLIQPTLWSPVQFLPRPNFNGVAGFDYSVSDGHGGTATAHVTVNVAAVNDAPVVATAIPDQTITEDSRWSYKVPTGTFTDVDSATLTMSATVANSNALPNWLAFDAATGTFSGTPPQNYNGAVTLRVAASDGLLTTYDDFTLTVNAVNDAPVVTPDRIAISKNAAISIPYATLMANDYDPDGDTLVFGDVTGNVHGAAAKFIGDTVFFYPDNGFVGEGGFDYTVSDGHGGTTKGHVTLDITDALHAGDDRLIGTEDDPLIILDSKLLSNDVAPSGVKITVTGMSNVTNGTLNAVPGVPGAMVFRPTAEFSGDAGFDYTISDGVGHTGVSNVSETISVKPWFGDEFYSVEAKNGFHGLAGFDYTVSDGHGGTSVGHVTVDVNGAPVALPDYLVTKEDGSTVDATDALLTANDVDPEGGKLKLVGVSNFFHIDPTKVQIFKDGSRQINVNIEEDYFGIASMDYTVEDARGARSTSTVYVSVLPTIDGYYPKDDYIAHPSDGSGTVFYEDETEKYLTNDSNVDGWDVDVVRDSDGHLHTYNETNLSYGYTDHNLLGQGTGRFAYYADDPTKDATFSYDMIVHYPTGDKTVKATMTLQWSAYTINPVDPTEWEGMGSGANGASTLSSYASHDVTANNGHHLAALVMPTQDMLLI